MVINKYSGHIFQVAESEMKVINESKKNGKCNILSVICDCCNKNIAHSDFNGTSLYLCCNCYNDKLNSDIL
jgi:hypothetical protein